MRYEVRTVSEDPRSLAAVRATTTQAQLATDIIRLLDLVWPVLREQGVPTGHNVVIYHDAGDGALIVEAGVEVPSGFAPSGQVQPAATPAGEAVTTAHCGDYGKLRGAYTAVQHWCGGHQRQPSGVSWEVYGDWSEDPAQVRTDVYLQLRPEGQPG
jgi:hypothetical protein